MRAATFFLYAYKHTNVYIFSKSALYWDIIYDMLLSFYMLLG